MDDGKAPATMPCPASIQYFSILCLLSLAVASVCAVGNSLLYFGFSGYSAFLIVAWSLFATAFAAFANAAARRGGAKWRDRFFPFCVIFAFILGKRVLKDGWLSVPWFGLPALVFIVLQVIALALLFTSKSRAWSAPDPDRNDRAA